jgi:hypothetical protein
MNKKSVTFPIMVWAVVAAVSPLYSQNAGFQIGQSQPAQTAALQNPQTTSGVILIVPMASPIQPTGNPVLPLSGTISRQDSTSASEISKRLGNGAITLLPAGGTVFVPAGTLVVESGAGMQPGTFLSAPLSPAAPPGFPQSEARGGGTIDRANDRSNRATKTGQQASPPDVTRLALGTPRDKVIEKYGNPIAFIMNMNGETLYFKGGVVVFVKDGVVAAPEIPDATTRR